MDSALDFIEYFPSSFIVGNLDDICDCPRGFFWSFSEYVAPFLGCLDDDMSCISKQPW